MRKGDRVIRASWYQESLRESGASTEALIRSEGTVKRTAPTGRPIVTWDAAPGRAYVIDPMLVELVE